jgi:hypothetical protein
MIAKNRNSRFIGPLATNILKNILRIGCWAGWVRVMVGGEFLENWVNSRYFKNKKNQQ